MARPRTSLNTFGKLALVQQYASTDGQWLSVKRAEKKGREIPAKSQRRWQARTRYRDSDGVVREVTRYATSKANAETVLKAALAKRVAPSTTTGGLRADLSLLDAGRLWIAQNEYAELSPRTRQQYADEFNRYIVGSSIQGLTLGEVNNVGTIERFLQAIADENGNAAAKAARRVLSNLLNLAVRHRALPHSASRDVRQPRARAASASATRRAASAHDTDRSLSRDERALVMKVADEHPDEHAIDVADLIAFLAGSGVRMSEALSCCWWSDVDLDATPHATVHVRGTKTDHADRTVPLPAWLADRLRERAVMRGSEGLLFGSPRLHDRTKARDQRNVNRLVRERFDDAGLPWATSHTFRRTVATYMDEAGAPLAEIANQLGHANVNVTATYLGRRQGSNRAADVL